MAETSPMRPASAVNAIKDCGIDKNQIDGIATTMSPASLAHYLGITPRPVEDDAPYAIAIVQLEEGPRMMSNIVGIENTPENLVLDMPLEVVFDDATEEISIPKFRPAGA